MAKNEISGRLYATLPNLDRHKAWAEVDLDALVHNYKAVCDGISPTVRRICVVKADAYGHGADECVSALSRAGCNFFAVSGIDEALALRDRASADGASYDILILGYTLPSQARLLFERDVTQAILSLEFARALSAEAVAADVRVKCHIAIDSGMNRIGICARRGHDEDTVADILQIMSLPGLEITGMFSHFASSDREDISARQYENFSRIISRLDLQGKRPPLCHICNSVAAVRREGQHLDGVRIGILLYGVPEAEEFKGKLRPVMKLKTIVSHIHTVPVGEKVGYDGEFVAESERRVATLPIGYADGYVRAFKGATVRVYTDGGVMECPILGRICMDQCMIDVTGTSARVGDVVLMFGDDEGQMLSSLARRAKTNEYECLCLVSSRIPRIYKK